jgi:hypothetical protein
MPGQVNRAALFKKLARQQARMAKLSTEIKQTIEQLAVDCQHEHEYETKEANDNGYGKWWYVHYRCCRLCDRKVRTGSSEYNSIDWSKNG